MDTKDKVATEMCEAEFDRFVQKMDLDFDKSKMDDEDKAGFKRFHDIIIRAMETGALVINEKGEPVFTPSDGKPITFHEPTGADRMAADTKQAGHNNRRTLAVIASMTGESIPRFAEMKQRDLKVVEVLYQLFMVG